MLDFAEMDHFCQSLGGSPIVGDETAHEAHESRRSRVGSKKSAIFALLVAQRGQCGPYGPLNQAGAMACDLELTRRRALSASALVPSSNDYTSALVLGATRAESRKTKATGGSSVVELTKGVPSPGSVDRPGTAQHGVSQHIRKLPPRVTLP